MVKVSHALNHSATHYQAIHNWKDATNDLRKHALHEYHKTSAVLMEKFVLTAEDATARIDLTLDCKAKQQVHIPKQEGIIAEI